MAQNKNKCQQYSIDYLTYGVIPSPNNVQLQIKFFFFNLSRETFMSEGAPYEDSPGQGRQ